MLRIPHCLDNRLTDGGKVVSPTHRPLLYYPETLFLFFRNVGKHLPDHTTTSVKNVFDVVPPDKLSTVDTGTALINSRKHNGEYTCHLLVYSFHAGGRGQFT
jgi:hypothetical protein